MAVRYLECFFEKYASKDVISQYADRGDFISQNLQVFI